MPSSSTPARAGRSPSWSDLCSPPRTRARVFALRAPWLPSRHERRVMDALGALGPSSASSITMFSPAYYADAFLDGGLARVSPYGLMGPPRAWIVGTSALALLCHRLGLSVPRRGRFATVPSADALEQVWIAQRDDAQEMLVDHARLLLRGVRPALEEASVQMEAAYGQFAASTRPPTSG